MARVNIYLPDVLAARAREAGLNVSAIARQALESRLAVEATNAWLDSLEALPRLGTPMTQAEREALWDAVHEEAGRAADRHLGDPDRTYG